MVRLQAGPGAGLSLSTCPTCRVTSLESDVFRITLLRRLQLPLPLTVRTCRCGRRLDACGHHRAACARVGVLGRRGYAVENVAARICRETGGRVTTNAYVHDLDLNEPHGGDGRRLEIVVDGLPLFGGAQLAVDSSAPSPQEDELLTKMGSLLLPPGERKRSVTPSWWALVPERGLSSSGRKLGVRSGCCDAGLNRLGAFVGALFLPSTVARAVAHSLLELPGASGADGGHPTSSRGGAHVCQPSVRR